MFNKIVILLLSLNFITTMVVGYFIHSNMSTEVSHIKKVLTFEPSIEDPIDKKFRADVYRGLGQLMMGQSIMSVGQLRIHHFTEPHSDKFYEQCPECQKERGAIIKESRIKNQDGEHGHGRRF